MHRLIILGAAMALAASTPSSVAAQATQGKAATRPAPQDTAGKLSFDREVYSYPRRGRRDPFGSLIATGDVRPMFADLMVSGIVWNPSGSGSVAMLKDVSTDELYRAKVGSVFGRIRITGIQRYTVSVAIDEFGFTRQETLSLNVPSPAERTP